MLRSFVFCIFLCVLTPGFDVVVSVGQGSLIPQRCKNGMAPTSGEGGSTHAVIPLLFCCSGT